MKLFFKIFLLCLILTFGFIRFKEYERQHYAWVFNSYIINSASISDSKKQKVFLEELKVDSIVLFDNKEMIEIDEVWIEKVRRRARKETITDHEDFIGVIKISKYSKDPYLMDSVIFTWGFFINADWKKGLDSFVDSLYQTELEQERWGGKFKSGYKHEIPDHYLGTSTFDPRSSDIINSGKIRLEIVKNKYPSPKVGRELTGYIILSKL